MARRRRLAPEDVDLDSFDALLFDLDGVITRTETLHAAAWKALFDDFLERWARDHDMRFTPFDVDADYVRYVDGRRRYDGVATFLRSRSIDLPAGTPADPPDALTVAGLGNHKDRYFNEALEREGVSVFDDTVALIHAWRDRGKAIAVVSASENCVPVLRRAGLLDLFAVRVTGVDADHLHLAGKPAPDTFLEAARRLDVAPCASVVFEDALAGVEAGAAGMFGLVVGVDRRGAAAALGDHGADVVVSDLRDLLPDR